MRDSVVRGSVVRGRVVRDRVVRDSVVRDSVVRDSVVRDSERKRSQTVLCLRLQLHTAVRDSAARSSSTGSTPGAQSCDAD